MSRWFYTRNNLFEAGPVVRVLIIGSMVAGFVVGVVAIDVAAGVGSCLVQELTTIRLRGIEFIETSISNSLTLCLIR